MATNEARQILVDTVTRLFADRVTKEVLESAESGKWPDRLWQTVEENGLTLPVVAEARGGAGMTWEDAFVIVRAAGRFAVPLPLPETIVAGWLLAEAGLDVPTGPLTIAMPGRGGRLELARAGSRWRLGGTAPRVPWGHAAGHVVVVAPADGEPVTALVAPAEARITPDRNLALEPRDTLEFDQATVLAAAPAGPRVPADAVRLYGALVRSAQMAGGLDFLLEQSVRYATERKQFGRPIGSFQAIQQALAVLAGHTAAAATAAAAAFRAADVGDLDFSVAVAKVRTGEAAGIAAGIAHQSHGAIGFTYEHSLHFVTRRLWSWRAEFGSEPAWAEALGRRVAVRGADELWPDLTGGGR